MDLDLTKTSLWISILIGAIIVAAASAGFQQYTAENEEGLNYKGIMRDSILGAIFVAMAWTLIPDSMTSLTEKIKSTVTTATTTAATTAATTVTKSSDIDVQVGPASF